MPRTPRSSRLEDERLDGLTTRPDGTVELTLNQMCLLLALRDMPQFRAPNRRQWTAAAMRYLVQLRENASFRNLCISAWGMPASLVTQWRGRGRAVTAEPTPAGRRLPDRHGRVWIIGHGPWEGFAALASKLETRRAARRHAALGKPIPFVRGDLWGGPLDGGHVALRRPARAEVTCAVTLADGSRQLARYRTDAPDEGETVWVPSNGLGEPTGPISETVIPRLEGKRGVRYRYCGMV